MFAFIKIGRVNARGMQKKSYRSQLVPGVHLPHSKGAIDKEAADPGTQVGVGQAARQVVQVAAGGRGKMHAANCPLPCADACHPSSASTTHTLTQTSICKTWAIGHLSGTDLSLPAIQWHQACCGVDMAESMHVFVRQRPQHACTQ